MPPRLGATAHPAGWPEAECTTAPRKARVAASQRPHPAPTPSRFPPAGDHPGDLLETDCMRPRRRPHRSSAPPSGPAGLEHKKNRRSHGGRDVRFAREPRPLAQPDSRRRVACRRKYLSLPARGQRDLSPASRFMHHMHISAPRPSSERRHASSPAGPHRRQRHLAQPARAVPARRAGADAARLPPTAESDTNSGRTWIGEQRS